MYEVLPNWHPLFVHFSVALLSISTLFFVALKMPVLQSLREPFKVLAYWNLWLGTGFAVITAIAGWFAFNSVAHDTASHAAMSEHRNWALTTLGIFIVVSLWSFKQYKHETKHGLTFTAGMLLGFFLLVSTGWHGSEAVYRYGLGVMSMPKVEGEGHAHEHSGNEHSSDSHKDTVDGLDKNEQMHSDVEMESSGIHKDSVSDHDKNPHSH
jgi:uncharacterized membrane protein